MEFYEHKRLQTKFVVDEIQLLRHDGKMDLYIIKKINRRIVSLTHEKNLYPSFNLSLNFFFCTKTR